MPRYIICLPAPKVGDFLLITPLLAALRAHSPDAHIALLLRRPDPGAWITQHPLVDQIVWCNAKGRARRLDLWRVAHELRRERFDVAIYRGCSGHFAWMLWLARIPVRIAGPYSYFRFLLTHTAGDTRDRADRHEVEYNLDLLRPLAITSLDERVCFPVSQAEYDEAARLLRSHGVTDDTPLIALNAGHGGSSRVWPGERFAEAADRLAAKIGGRVVIVGQKSAPNDAGHADTIERPDTIDLTGQTTLGQLGGVLGICRLHLSVDTGTAHLAAAMQTPCVMLFPDKRAWQEHARWRPWQTPQRLLGPSQHCAGCEHACHRKGVECLNSITVEQVVDAGCELLAHAPAGDLANV